MTECYHADLINNYYSLLTLYHTMVFSIFLIGHLYCIIR